MTQPTKELIDNWRTFEKLHADMGNTLLKIMRHKDTDKEDLWDAHLRYTAAMQNLSDMRLHLRKHFPNQGWVRSYPWNA